MDYRGQVTSIRDKSGNTINRGRAASAKSRPCAPIAPAWSSSVAAEAMSSVPSIAAAGILRRTYVIGGVSYVHVYRGYYYHGRPYFVYVPPYYYAPAYYGWVFNPWPRPVPIAGVGTAALVPARTDIISRPTRLSVRFALADRLLDRGKPAAGVRGRSRTAFNPSGMRPESFWPRIIPPVRLRAEHRSC